MNYIMRPEFGRLLSLFYYGESAFPTSFLLVSVSLVCVSNAPSSHLTLCLLSLAWLASGQEPSLLITIIMYTYAMFVVIETNFKKWIFSRSHALHTLCTWRSLRIAESSISPFSTQTVKVSNLEPWLQCSPAWDFDIRCTFLSRNMRYLQVIKSA